MRQTSPALEYLASHRRDLWQYCLTQLKKKVMLSRQLYPFHFHNQRARYQRHLTTE